MLLRLVSQFPRRIDIQTGEGNETGAVCSRGELGEALFPNAAIVSVPRVGVNDGPRPGAGQLERKTQVRPPTRRVSTSKDPRFESEPLSRRERDAGMPPGGAVSGLAAQLSSRWEWFESSCRFRWL